MPTIWRVENSKGQGLLDTDKGRLKSTGKQEDVTCKRCINKMKG
jgi:hypothetical protein